MQTARRPQRAAVLLGLLLVALALLVVDSTLGLHPRACTLCHQALSEGLGETSHSEVGCLSCHLEAGLWSLPGFKAEQWTRMYPTQLTGRTPSPARGVSRDACARCHETLEPLTERNGLIIAHESCAPSPSQCSSCHGAQSHGTALRWGGQPVMDDCVDCHIAKLAPQECDTCHEGRVQTDRLRRGAWRVTHGPGWESTHPMGDYDACATCHTESSCMRCHGVPVPHPASFGSTHGQYAKAPKSTCYTCHEMQSFCNDCHGIEMPHPHNFLENHKKAADSREDPLCLSCHETKACTRCHERHDAHPKGAELARLRRQR
jgi:hypothetical protein